jgi:hypothetical protein
LKEAVYKSVNKVMVVWYVFWTWSIIDEVQKNCYGGFIHYKEFTENPLAPTEFWFSVVVGCSKQESIAYFDD